jgi:agmatinase
MKFPNYFADAESNYKDADFVIFGIPYDKTSSFRSGAYKGPSQIRVASWNFETFNIRTGLDFKDTSVHDYGDLNVKDLSTLKMVEKVKYFTKKILLDGKIPIAIGGDHSITPGIIYAFPKDIAVLSLDAHLDFRRKYENEIYNHACVTRRISDHIKIENIGVIGVRSAEKEEYEDAKNLGLFLVNSFEIKEKGLESVLTKTKKYFENNKMYLTVDIDVVDPAYAPGVGTPEPFGITSFDLLKIIDFFAPQIIGFDIVETNADYDNGETSVLAAKIIRNLIEQITFLKDG